MDTKRRNILIAGLAAPILALTGVKLASAEEEDDGTWSQEVYTIEEISGMMNLIAPSVAQLIQRQALLFEQDTELVNSFNTLREDVINMGEIMNSNSNLFEGKIKALEAEVYPQPEKKSAPREDSNDIPNVTEPKTAPA